jgi:hypothetical protein
MRKNMMLTVLVLLFSQGIFAQEGQFVVKDPLDTQDPMGIILQIMHAISYDVKPKNVYMEESKYWKESDRVWYGTHVYYDPASPADAVMVTQTKNYGGAKITTTYMGDGMQALYDAFAYALSGFARIDSAENKAEKYIVVEIRALPGTYSNHNELGYIGLWHITLSIDKPYGRYFMLRVHQNGYVPYNRR